METTETTTVSSESSPNDTAASVIATVLMAAGGYAIIHGAFKLGKKWNDKRKAKNTPETA